MKSNTMKKTILAVVSLSVFSMMVGCQQGIPSCGDWTSEKCPIILGHRVAEEVTRNTQGVWYAQAAGNYGALIFAETVGDATITERVMAMYEPFLTGDQKPRIGHVDNNVFGIAPLELYRQTGRKECLELGKYLADIEWDNPRPEDGLTPYTRFWVDDIYMVCSLQAQAYKNTKDPIYLDRAAMFILAYAKKLQQPNGLFHHTDQSPHFWGRGNGWAAAGMAEVILAMPVTHPQRSAVMAVYLEQMQGLLNCQAGDGMWHQVLDNPESYKETSCTGMFTYAIATGVDQGWLPKELYEKPAYCAWSALANYIVPPGRIAEVCVGTNAEDSKEHYLNRPRGSGDFHGQAGFLWATTAIIRLQR